MYRHKPNQWFNLPLATAAFMTIFMLSIDGALAACRGEWAEGNNYAVGDIASFDGIRYRVIQAHTSFANAGWTPPRTPALWTSSNVGACPNIPFDPGVRAGVSAGQPIAGLTAAELAAFDVGLEDFAELEGVGDGLGPRFNADGCGACHSKPAIGGTADSTNPQFPLANALGARNAPPSFITVNGPIREARLKRNANGTPDGGVHALFVVSGRVDDTGNASGCNAVQEDFAPHVSSGNVINRIPSPNFGNGLMEQIPDATILNNVNANAATKSSLGISGRVNRNGNDGTITRFGWKAQNKSLLIFSAEAYNVEMGITNEGFQQERDENPTCQFAQLPNDVTLPRRRPARPAARPRSPTAAISSMPSAVRCAIRRRSRRATPPSRRCVTGRSICSPTWRCTTWGRDLPTKWRKVMRVATSSVPPRCGASASARSSCTTAAPRIC
jgi:hypothetical protein